MAPLGIRLASALRCLARPKSATLSEPLTVPYAARPLAELAEDLKARHTGQLAGRFGRLLVGAGKICGRVLRCSGLRRVVQQAVQVELAAQLVGVLRKPPGVLLDQDHI